MSDDRLAIVGGRMHVRYGLTASGEQVYLFGAADGTPLDTLRGMLQAASAYIEQLEARGEMTA
jgi:hypothetical protein